MAVDERPTPARINALTPRTVLARAAPDAPSPDVVRSAAADVGRLAAALYYMRHPAVALHHGEVGRGFCVDDGALHVQHLADSLLAGSADVLADYLGWCSSVLAHAKVSHEVFGDFLDATAEALQLALPPEHAAKARAALAAARELAVFDVVSTASLIDESTPLGALARRFNTLLVAGDRQAAAQLVLDALAAGVSIQDVYLGIFQASQYEIGRLWQVNALSVAQEHYCTAATQVIMSQLHDHVFGRDKIGRSLVATCVTDDLHELGIRMVCDFFEMEGWDTWYLGANTPIDAVSGTLAERRPDVLAISATLGTHLHRVRAMVAAVRAVPALSDTIILVGGLPFVLDEALWERMGADGTARDAASAVAVGTTLVQQRHG